MQSGRFLVGIEGDISWSEINGSDEWTTHPDGSCETGWRLETDINWLATLRARAGLTSPTMLFYITGGLAFADVDSRYSLVKDHFVWSGSEERYQDRLDGRRRRRADAR